MLEKIMRFFEVHICAMLFMAMSTIIMAQIICRALGMPVGGTEETARYMFVWIVYLAASKAVQERKHLAVEILPLFLKGKAKLCVYLFSNVVVLVFALLLCYYGAVVLQGMTVNPQFSAATGTNMIIPYAAPTVGSFFMIIRTLQNCADDIRRIAGKEDEKKEEMIL